MNLSDFFKNSAGQPPEKNLVIVGVNPIIVEMTANPELFYDMLMCSPHLKITIIYESDSENFNQSLFYDRERSKNKIEFDKLQAYRSRLIGGNRGKTKKSVGFIDDVLNHFKNDKDRINIRERIKLFQNNRRHNINLIYIDDVIWYSETLLDIPTLDMYRKVISESNHILFYRYIDYIENLLNTNNATGKIEGNIFLSKAGDELIQLYDINSYPRGIYPRKAFYSDAFQRYSVWVFVFNRKGELLLHKRSSLTADNRSLWDKSVGGHVDITDSSTIITAKRELVEEMFLPEAEYTKYMRANLSDLIDFGEWDIDKRTETHLQDSFNQLDKDDWIIFRATDSDEIGEVAPMTIRRKSPRIIYVKDKDEQGNVIMPDGKPQEHVEIKYTRFMSDVFMCIAPEGYIDNEYQMNGLLNAAEVAGAASAHKLISIEDLIDEIEINPNQFTDDMIYMCSEKKRILVEFSEAVKFIFRIKEVYVKQ